MLNPSFSKTVCIKCYRYTYGLPVEGILTAVTCLTQPQMRTNIQLGSFCQNITGQQVNFNDSLPYMLCMFWTNWNNILDTDNYKCNP